jgi:demethylmenaquinone methyltransferase/2-methoxy-6-polyprenyl-1,4-benzoquinol methylase
MREYYRERAPIYDRVYAYPERQSDLRILESRIPLEFADLDVLEIAAGTGYWTQHINLTANSLLATDATKEALRQIQQRPGLEQLPTQLADAYALALKNKRFTGAFAGLWLSHVPKQRLSEFFSSLHACLAIGAKVVLIDNSSSQCERLPISYTDSQGNTYQDRVLDDGSRHKVLKNFPNQKELELMIAKFRSDFYFEELEHFWFCKYIAK